MGADRRRFSPFPGATNVMRYQPQLVADRIVTILGKFRAGWVIMNL